MKKSLICITTCMRLHEIKKYILPYIDFCNRHPEFDFLLSLDGYDANYIEFCKEFHIPVLFSEEREGVGISKNRVLKKFGENYDSIFFIEDDVELIDETVFFDQIYISETLNIPHLSGKVIDDRPTMQFFDHKILEKGFKGGGYFNFFRTRELLKVGGWHPYFSRLKRHGHAEHTYRFYYAGLQEFPFIALQSTFFMTFIHDPEHVTHITEKNYVDGYFHPEEWKLIQQKLTYYPVITMSPFHFINFDRSFNQKIHFLLLEQKGKKYPLIVNKKERRKSLSEFYFFNFLKEKRLLRRIKYFLCSFLISPFNNLIKHHIKTKWLGLK